MLHTRDGYPATIVPDHGNVLGNTLAVKLELVNAGLGEELVRRLGRPLRPEECNTAYFDEYLPELKPAYLAIRDMVGNRISFLHRTEAMKDAPDVVNLLADNFMFHTVTSRLQPFRTALPIWMGFRSFKTGYVVDCTNHQPKGPAILAIPGGVVAIIESDAYKLWEIQRAYAEAKRELPDLYLMHQPGERMLPPAGTTSVQGWRHNGRSIEKMVVERARDRFDLVENIGHRVAA